jgi:transcriptional regulator with XRE-family HTH domain
VGENVLRRLDTVKTDAQTRVRMRINARLKELGMTARELARAVRGEVTKAQEVDAWISGVLHGRQGLQLRYLDSVAEKLGLSPSELVRHDDAAMRELAPHEMRLLKHYQNWPREMQDRWLAMLDYFAALTPDKETGALLDRLRAHPPSLRRPVMKWLLGLLEEGIPPEVSTGGVVLGPTEVLAARDTTHRGPKGRK